MKLDHSLNQFFLGVILLSFHFSNIIASPQNKQITELSCALSVQYTVENNKFESDKKLLEKSTIEYEYSCDLACSVAIRRVKAYQKDSKKRYECGPETNCPIIIGHSYLTTYDTMTLKKTGMKRYPVKVTKHWKTEGYKWVGDEKKWVITSKGESNANNDYQTIDVMIQTFFPSDDPTTIGSLTPNYVLTISGGKYIDRIDPNSYPNLDAGSGMKWDDAKQQLVNDEGPFDATIPYSTGIDRKQIHQEGLEITPLLIKNCEEFDAFLNDPENLWPQWHKGLLQLETNANSRQFNDQEETISKLYVKTAFRPGN